MPFVLDASVAACRVLADEAHPTADAALERLRHDEAPVPGPWWFERRNIIVVNERRGRLDESDTATFLRNLDRLRIAVDRTPESAGVLDLARKHRLSAYDASYLELARREAAPLATLDRQLAEAATTAGVQLLSSPNDIRSPHRCHRSGRRPDRDMRPLRHHAGRKACRSPRRMAALKA